MEGQRKAIRWIKDNIKPEDEGEAKSLAEALQIIEDGIPPLPEGAKEFASLHLYLSEDGQVGFTYSKDARVESRTLVCSLLETAEAILAKEGEPKA